MTRQDQAVEGGQAYQAGGDITVSHGMDADQMASVMISMAKQLQVHFAEAEAKLDERLSEFRKAVLEEFAKPENEQATESFKDPDFQFVLNDAQKVYGRNGTTELRYDLVRLLVQRSQHDSRDRVAKVLNQAIEIAGSLSKSEYAALAVNFFLTNAQASSGSAAQLLDLISAMLRPFINDLSDNATVYGYLEGQRCVSINTLVEKSLPNILTTRYASALSDGFDPLELQSIDLAVPFNSLLETVTATGKANTPARFLARTSAELQEALRAKGVSNTGILKAQDLYARTVPDQGKVVEIFSNTITGWDHLERVWRTTPLSQMTLTAVGKAIAHSSMVSKTPFNSELSIWVS